VLGIILRIAFVGRSAGSIEDVFTKGNGSLTSTRTVSRLELEMGNANVEWLAWRDWRRKRWLKTSYFLVMGDKPVAVSGRGAQVFDHGLVIRGGQCLTTEVVYPAGLFLEWASSDGALFLQCRVPTVLSSLMGVDCMQPNSRKHLRVITVFLGFISVAVAGLWVMGGAESECTVEVTSPLSPMVLSQRFEERFRNLQPIDIATLQADAIRRFEFQEVGPMPVSMLCGWGGRGGILMPLADIVVEGNTDGGLLSMDPAVVFTDAEFVQHSALRMEGFGRDGQFV
jgi:hypothetical protein